MIQVGPRALSLLLVAVLLSLLAPRAALGNASLSAGALDDQVSPQESQEECSPEVESWTASRLEETDRCECGTLASGSLLAAKGGGKGLTTPGKFFGGKTAKDAGEALGKKFGPPRSSRPGADTFYNPKSGRSYNVYTDPAHGPPHVDIRTRGPVPDRKVPLGGGN